MLTPCLLVNAKIIDKQGFKGHHIGGKGLLPELAECIAHAQIVLVCGNIDRVILLLQ